MIVAPILIIFAGYVGVSYGVVLMKSWEIPFRAWVSPLHPYQWPLDGSPPQTMPDGQLLPGGRIAPGTEGTTPPSGISVSTWAEILQCIDQGGNCSANQYGSIVGHLLGKLFGWL